MRTVCIVGIGTMVGKTLVSAIVCEKLGALYWKPIATGTEEVTDSMEVARLISAGSERVLPSIYSFRYDLSPHIAASMSGSVIDLDRIVVPPHASPLVIECAGGVLVPLNDEHTNLDLLMRLGVPVILVSKHYLGSINHTLLTVEALRARGIKIEGIVFNGTALPDTERIIEVMAKLPILGRVPELSEVTRSRVQELSKTFEIAA